eukprot:Rmarinus@m.22930
MASQLLREVLQLHEQRVALYATLQRAFEDYVSSGAGAEYDSMLVDVTRQFATIASQVDDLWQRSQPRTRPELTGVGAHTPGSREEANIVEKRGGVFSTQEETETNTACEPSTSAADVVEMRKHIRKIQTAEQKKLRKTVALQRLVLCRRVVQGLRGEGAAMAPSYDEGAAMAPGYDGAPYSDVPDIGGGDGGPAGENVGTCAAESNAVLLEIAGDEKTLAAAREELAYEKASEEIKKDLVDLVEEVNEALDELKMIVYDDQ